MNHRFEVLFCSVFRHQSYKDAQVSGTLIPSHSPLHLQLHSSIPILQVLEDMFDVLKDKLDERQGSRLDLFPLSQSEVVRCKS